MKKYLVTSYAYEGDSVSEKPFILEEVEGELEINGFNLVFKVDDTVVAVFEKNQVWAKEIKEEE